MLADRDEILRLADQHGTPLWLLDTGRILSTMNRLRDGFRAGYPASEITYSVKTNYLTAILRAVLAAGYRLEVVSRHELELALRAGATPDRLLFNGPVKSRDDLQLCHAGNIDVHVDSLDELAAAAAIGTADRPFRLGLRIAARMANHSTSRFGIDCDNPDCVEAVRQLLSQNRVQVAGLHMHHSSQRNASSYCERIDRLLEVAGWLHIQPEYVDIGGGVGSEPPAEIAAKLAYPLDSHQSFAKTVGTHARRKLAATGTRLILEPGIGVLANSMNYVTTVVSTKTTGAERIAICDGSMFDVNPLRSTISPPCHLLKRDPADSTDNSSGKPIPLFGGTCMEIDRIGAIETNQTPETGDRVVVTNTGAYACSLSPQFIVPQAPVWSIQSKTVCRQRQISGQFSGAGE